VFIAIVLSCSSAFEAAVLGVQHGAKGIQSSGPDGALGLEPGRRPVKGHGIDGQGALGIDWHANVIGTNTSTLVIGAKGVYKA
jgi:hypothetical protein